MAISQQEFLKFEALVASNGAHNEIKCGGYLEYAKDLLLGVSGRDLRCNREERLHYGSSDFVVTGMVSDGRGDWSRHARIWELKAPQCYVFERDDNDTRFRPTRDLIKAENQLLHYASEMLSSDSFRVRQDVMKFENIKMGGIIIGRSSDRLVKDPKHLPQAKTSLLIRDRFFYEVNHIKILTWDAVVEHLRP